MENFQKCRMCSVNSEIFITFIPLKVQKTMDVELQNVIAHFPQVKEIREIEPIQSGLINRTYRIVTEGADDYILQCINHLVFTDVELLQHNIECVTEHIRAKLLECVSCLRWKGRPIISMVPIIGVFVCISAIRIHKPR